MYGISAQVSVYPLRQDNLSPAVDAVVGALSRPGIERRTGEMSTVVWGDDEKVFPALLDAFRQAAAQGHMVMVITLSNACPVPGKGKSSPPA